MIASPTMFQSGVSFSVNRLTFYTASDDTETIILDLSKHQKQVVNRVDNRVRLGHLL